jgi:hypothetical protein
MAGVKPLKLPTKPDRDFETLPRWAKDYFVILRPRFAATVLIPG